MSSNGNKLRLKLTKVGRKIPMEQIEFDSPSKRKVTRKAQVCVVDSGDLEVLLEPAKGESSRVFIWTSADGFRDTWKAVLDRFFAKYDVVVQIRINDAGATPGGVL
jgi:malonate decarboxylase delta subunit